MSDTFYSLNPNIWFLTFWCLFRRWVLRLLWFFVRYGQWTQAKGSSPVWVLMCSCRLPFCALRYEQKWQANGFSPVCVLMWASNLCRQLNVFWQYVQAWFFTGVVEWMNCCPGWPTSPWSPKPSGEIWNRTNKKKLLEWTV